MVYFKALSWHSPEGTEENHKKHDRIFGVLDEIQTRHRLNTS
jgi:hypothetical protein